VAAWEWLIITILCTIVLSRGVLPLSEGSLFFVYFLLFSLSEIAFCFMIATFFTRSMVGELVGGWGSVRFGVRATARARVRVCVSGWLMWWWAGGWMGERLWAAHALPLPLLAHSSVFECDQQRLLRRGALHTSCRLTPLARSNSTI
jgi:hypothetical protein